MHYLHGAILKDLGLIDEAVAVFRTRLAIDPHDHVAHSNLLLTLCYDPLQTATDLCAEAIRWRVQQAEAVTPYRDHPNERDPDRRLRVGYVSADFMNHVASLYTIPLFEHHDRKAIELCCYSATARSDAHTDRFRALSDRFVDIAALDDPAAVEVIRQDRVDVLVDLGMHMSNSRLLLFAAKPAPVQVTWLAYPGTTGLSTFDARITDVFLDPPDLNVTGAYTEPAWRLPHSYWCYDPLTNEPSVGPLPALRSGRITFGCLNNFCKTNEGVFALWSKVLLAVEGSRFLLLARAGETRRRALDAFARHGIGAERIHFADREPRRVYLDIYNTFDICLDTFPYNGHTTSLDAYWMGVPVVTLVGHTIVGRGGSCQAHNLELSHLVARTPEEYVRIAFELASDLKHLAELRSEIRGRVQESPLMNGKLFAEKPRQQNLWVSQGGSGKAPRA